MLLAAPTSAGKSSMVAQMAISWAYGREAFGLKPAKPLRVLLIQAENDDGDMREEALGVVTGLGVEPDEWEKVYANTQCLRLNSAGGKEFIAQLRQHIRKFKPDIVVIDPLNSYIGGKGVNDQSTVTEFCRAGLNPILETYRCACIVVHHTVKTNSKERDTSKWKPGDWAYNFAGSSELVNWARAMLAIDPTHDPRVFKVVAAKRGKRANWRDDFDVTTLIKYFTHAAKGIFWQEATAADIQRAQTAAESAKAASGRKKVWSDDRLLASLKDGPLTLAGWHEALLMAGCTLGKSGLSKRADSLLATGDVVKNEAGEWSSNLNFLTVRKSGQIEAA
jgi:hypothetical protein